MLFLQEREPHEEELQKYEGLTVKIEVLYIYYEHGQRTDSESHDD